MGIRDLHKIPAGTEITTKELLLYNIEFTPESIAEQGWYRFEENNNKKTFHYINLEDVGVGRTSDNTGKKGKSLEQSKSQMTLGSMPLRQYESAISADGGKK